MLATLFGFYYWGAARDDCEGRQPLRFYWATISGRLWLSAAFACLVVGGECPKGLLVVALANIVNAWALRNALGKGPPRASEGLSI